MNQLKELEIEEVSLVDAGANPAANILLIKRKGESEMAEKQIEKQEVKPEENKDTQAELAKIAAERAELEKKAAELSAKAEELAKRDAESAAQAEAVAKAKETYDTLIKSLAEHVEKADNAEMLKVAQKYELLGRKAEELAPMLKSLKASPELYESMIKTLDDALAAVTKAKTFEEIGKSGYGTVSNDQQKVEAIAKKYLETEPQLSWRQALDKAWQDNPNLQY